MSPSVSAPSSGGPPASARRRAISDRLVAALFVLALACAVWPAVAWSQSSDSVPPRRKKRELPPPWTLGSTAAEVRRAQGAPEFVERLGSLGYEVWHFGRSWLRLSIAEERVVGWASADGTLNVALRPAGAGGEDTVFTIGSSRDDLLRVQGTPTSYVAQPATRSALLGYGAAQVQVSAADGRVLGWSDPGGRVLKAVRAAALSSAATPRPSAPASLTAALAWADATGDGYLDGGEEGTLTVIVRNGGRGTAYGLVPDVSGDAGVRLAPTVPLDSLPAGRSATMQLRLIADATVEDGVRRFRIGVRERNGFDLDPPASLEIPVRRERAPHLVLAGIAVNDQSGNGRIEPREIVEVIARVRNDGAGDTRDLEYTIAAGEGVTLTPDSRSRGTIGTLHAGESRDLRFSAFANSRATGFPVQVALREPRARFDAMLTLPLAIDRPLAELPSLVVRGRETRSAESAPLVSPVDTGIPRAPVRPGVLAVVFGVERYQFAPATPLARRDAAVFKEYARSVFGVGDDDSRLLFRTDDEVTGTELRRAFAEGGWLARRVTAASDVVVYWAGHGVTDPKTHRAYLLPNDGDPAYPAQTGLALDDLYERLAALGARSVTVFVDACFSGRGRDGSAMIAGARGVVVSLEHPALRGAGMAVYSAASGVQLANAWPDGQHGVFTYALLAGLRGAADTNGDGIVTAGELANYLARDVPRTAARLDREQTPEFVARDPARAVVILR